jgi:hypothetical protein
MGYENIRFAKGTKMEICITIGDVTHCYHIPIYEWPFRIPDRGPGPVNLPYLLSDAMVLASVNTALKNINTGAVRETALDGVRSAIRVLDDHAGQHVSIKTPEIA